MEMIADIKISKFMERQILRNITGNGSSVFAIRHSGTALVIGMQHYGTSASSESVEGVRTPKKETYFVRIINKGEKKTYKIDARGITQIYSKNAKEYLWPDFWLIKYNARYFFMRMNDGESYFVIPRKALPAEADNELMTFLEDNYRDGMGRKLEKI